MPKKDVEARKDVETRFIQSEISQLSEQALDQSIRLNSLLRELYELVGGGSEEPNESV